MANNNSHQKISSIDAAHLKKLRDNIENFLSNASDRYAQPNSLLLDIAPQVHKGAKSFFPEDTLIETLDIDPKSNATYIEDLCSQNFTLDSNKYDYVVCTEVLEHTLQPFQAVNNIFNILKPGGITFVSTPFNLRIHGPLPDCWRFTEHGLRELFKKFDILELNPLEAPDRFLMPIQYTLIAAKPY